MAPCMSFMGCWSKSWGRLLGSDVQIEVRTLPAAQLIAAGLEMLILTEMPPEPNRL